MAIDKALGCKSAIRWRRLSPARGIAQLALGLVGGAGNAQVHAGFSPPPAPDTRT